MDNDTTRRLARVADELTAGYEGAGGVNRIGDTELPSRARVETVLRRLLALAFPGYFGGSIDERASVDIFVSGHLDALFVELSGLVARTVRFSSGHGLPAPCTAADGDDPDALAERITLEYLAELPAVRELIKTDVQAAYEGDPAATSPVEVVLCYPGLLAVAVHRLAHPLQRCGVPFIPRVMNEWAHARTGTDIHPGAEIGPRFFIDHATGVVVGETTVIGERVKLYQGVTLGALSIRHDDSGRVVRGAKRHPTIEDDVTVYANATILGGETVIGRGAVIGGGCWVTASVPAGARVVTDTRTKGGNPD
jgi:serine O-acetyltransferase